MMRGSSKVKMDSKLTYNSPTLTIYVSSQDDVVPAQPPSAASSPTPELKAAPTERSSAVNTSSALSKDDSSSPRMNLLPVNGSSVSIINGFVPKRGSSSKATSSAMFCVNKQQVCLQSESSSKQGSSFSSQGTNAELHEKTSTSTPSSTAGAHRMSPPRKPPRMLNFNSLERDVYDSKTLESLLKFDHIQSDNLDKANNFDECDNVNELNDASGKASRCSTILANNNLDENDCHLVHASFKDVPVYCLPHDDSGKMGHELNNDGKHTEHQEEPLVKGKNLMVAQVTRATLNSEDRSAAVGDPESKNSIPANHTTLLSSTQQVQSQSHQVNQKQHSFKMRVEQFTDLDTTKNEEISSITGSEEAGQNRDTESTQLDVTEKDKDSPNPDQVEQHVLLPSVIAEARRRSQASIAHNRYVFRSPSRSPTRNADFNTSENWVLALPNDNSPFVSLQRKFRNSMRKMGSPKLKASDPCPQSIILFLKNEQEYNEKLAKIVACSASCDSVVEECLGALNIIKASSDSVIDYVSKHPLIVTTVVEAFYKQIDHFKLYATAMKEMRNIEVASYEEEGRDLGKLLEKLAIVNDRLPFYCSTFQSWLQLMPNEDNVAELRTLVDLLEQIRLNGLIPDQLVPGEG